jgi:hypothetical protein
MLLTRRRQLWYACSVPPTRVSPPTCVASEVLQFSLVAWNKQVFLVLVHFQKNYSAFSAFNDCQNLSSLKESPCIYFCSGSVKGRGGVGHTGAFSGAASPLGVHLGCNQTADRFGCT